MDETITKAREYQASQKYENAIEVLTKVKERYDVVSGELGVVPSNRDPATIDFMWRREEGGVGREVETVEKGG